MENHARDHCVRRWYLFCTLYPSCYHTPPNPRNDDGSDQELCGEKDGSFLLHQHPKRLRCLRRHHCVA